MDGKSPTAKDERHNSTKLSFWNWKVFGGQNEKSNGEPEFIQVKLSALFSSFDRTGSQLIAT